jgi:hypothetical protein
MRINGQEVTEYAQKRWGKKPPFWLNFWSHLNKKENGCWEWSHRRNPSGYGTLKVMNKHALAHRIAWEIAVSEIPENLCVLHRCDNPSCCNPAHLFLGTREENNADKMSKGRHVSLNGTKHPRTYISEDKVKEIRRMAESKIPHRRIAQHFNMPYQTVYSIISRASWKHVS